MRIRSRAIGELRFCGLGLRRATLGCSLGLSASCFWVTVVQWQYLLKLVQYELKLPSDLPNWSSKSGVRETAQTRGKISLYLPF